MRDVESFVRFKMAASKGCFVVSLVIMIFFLLSVSCLPEPGKKDLHFDKNRTYAKFSKTMNKGYSVSIKGSCSGYSGVIKIKWRLEVSECAERFAFLKDNDEKSMAALWNIYANHSLNGEQEVPCSTAVHLKDVSDEVKELITTGPPPVEESPSDESEDTNKEPDTSDSYKEQEVPSTKTAARKTKTSSTKYADTSERVSTTAASRKSPTVNEANRKRRNADSSDNQDTQAEQEEEEDQDPSDNNNSQDNQELQDAEEDQDPKGNKDRQKGNDKTKKEKKTGKQGKAKTQKKTDEEEKVKDQVCVTKHDGVFLLLVNAVPVDEKQDSKDFKLTLNVEMKGKHGYLSASDWPLYPFYGFMSLLYVFYGVVWLIVSACQWRDLLRIQFWIGGVIALGMLEKAVFFSEYNNVNITGETNPALTIFAELVSCVKRTLARILVIIVSMGFGIVKPRLGTTLHRVLGIGALYFILAAIEGCFRSLHPKSDPGRQQLIASIPLAVLDASICWWIFMSLVQTTRTLRIRRNLVKLSLYRHFTNTLIFAVLASVAYMIWSIKTHRFAKDGCITDWSELWLDEAFWHFLFSIVLLVIMILWRPTANNQRYAFTPIVDFGDDDEDDDNMTLSDAFDGMKMRNVKNVPEVAINGDSKRKHKPEDDLKWVEENIPSSAADAVLPSVLDSDEELMTTKFEMSKME